MTELPAKYRGLFRSKNASIKMLLKRLGLPKSVWKVSNFWGHWHGQLDLILHDAEKLYKLHAARVHPRKSTDDQEESKQLNALWRTIKKRFKDHTNPILFVGREYVPKALSLPKLRYICKLDTCGQEFRPAHVTQKFCCKAHMNRFHNRKQYYKKIRPAKRKILVKCKLPSCGTLFWKWETQKRRCFCRRQCGSDFHNLAYLARNRTVINAKKRKWHGDHGDKYRAQKREYDRTHKAERRARQAKWAKNKPKRLKAARRSLLDLLNLVGSHDRDIRNRCEAGDVAVRETILPINTDQVGAVLPDEHESIKLDIFCTLTAHNDQVVLGST